MWLNRQRYNNLHKQQDQSLTLNPITVIYLLIGLGVGASLSAKECGANFSYILIPYNIILWPYELGKAISAAQEYFNAKIDLIKRDKYGEHAAEYYDLNFRSCQNRVKHCNY